jgi:hypothetical protein
MFMHPDQARDHGVIGKVYSVRACRQLCAIRPGYALDTSVIDYNSLIFLGRGTGAIDHAYVLERNDRSVDGDERLEAGREHWLPKNRPGGGEDEDDGSLGHTMEQA